MKSIEDYQLRKWTDDEKNLVLKIRKEQNIGPKAISILTGFPKSQIQWWLYGHKRKSVVNHNGQTDIKRENSVRSYYRSKKRDWYRWKSQTIKSTLNRRGGTTLTVQNIYDWLKSSERNCYYCKTSIDETNLSIDHKIPVSRIGSNELDNLVISCKNCNFTKGSLNDKEYIELLNLINTWEETSAKSLMARLKNGKSKK